MIKKSELRIGNWFNTLFNDKFKVEELRRDFVMGISENGFCNTSYNDLQPILISPEILEKAGFKGIDIKEANLDGHIKLNEDYRLEYSYAFKEFSINGMFLPTSPKYLHQLQNLFFALSGEELTITL